MDYRHRYRKKNNRFLRSDWCQCWDLLPWLHSTDASREISQSASMTMRHTLINQQQVHTSRLLWAHKAAVTGTICFFHSECYFDYSIVALCVFMPVAVRLSLTKGGYLIVNAHSYINACCVLKAWQVLTVKSTQLLTGKHWKTALHPVASTSQTLGHWTDSAAPINHKFLLHYCTKSVKHSDTDRWTELAFICVYVSFFFFFYLHLQDIKRPQKQCRVNQT